MLTQTETESQTQSWFIGWRISFVIDGLNLLSLLAL